MFDCFLNGTLDLHVQLEKELAEFVGKDDALVYSTGFTVNEGVVSCLTDRNDYIICDDRDHASIVDGRRLSFSTQLKYKHNDMEALEKELQKCKPESVKLIVVDGVFSMEGDLANLPEIVRLKDKYNASIMVDEAHGLGVFGRDGRGVCDHFGLTDQVDVIMGTFSKSLASIGGFVAADKDTINWLRHNSRSYIFSASNTPAATAAARAALHILKSEPERRENLWKITNYALDCFRQAGFEIGDTEVGANLSTGEKGWTDVEAEAMLSGRLLNNRLMINGNFGYKENVMANSNFVGDFEAIWLLTKNGDFRLRGYNQTNDRYFTKSTLTTQGVGLMYKKDFNTWDELFRWFLWKRRKSSLQKRSDD